MTDEVEPLSPFSIITITLDVDDPTPVINIGDLDIWSAYTILWTVLEHVADYLPEPRFHDEDVAVEDD